MSIIKMFHVEQLDKKMINPYIYVGVWAFFTAVLL